MVTPKISMETMREVSQKLNSSQENLANVIEKMLIEQTDIRPILCLAGLVNLEMLRGFVTCYAAISIQMEKDAIAELESLVK